MVSIVFNLSGPSTRAAQRECLLQLLPCLRVRPEVVVRLSDGLANLGFHLRLLCEFAFDAHGRAVQGSPLFRSGSGFVCGPACLFALAWASRSFCKKSTTACVSQSLGLGTTAPLAAPEPPATC